MSLLQISLSGAVFIFVVAVLRLFTIHRLPKTTFLVLWDIALIRLLLPATFRFPLGISSAVSRSVPVLNKLERTISGFTAGVLPDSPDGIEEKAEKAVQIVRGGTLSVSVFPILWAVGAAAMAGYFIVSYFRCRREFRTALPVQNDFVSHWLYEHALWRNVDIRQLTGLSTPLAYGIFRPVILMPKDTDWRDERQLQYMLFHEYVHVRRFDAMGKLIASVVLCIHWFNPLVWILYVLFNQDIELSCDECVIRHFGRENRKAYAAALVCMEERKSGLIPFGNYFSKNATKERIKAIMKFKKKNVFSIIFTIIIVVAGAVAAFAMAPKAAKKDFADVLLGAAPFLYVAGENAEPKNISDVPALFDPDDDYMKIWAFAILDLDRDGNAEVVLSVNGMAGDMGGSLILHQIDDKIYGYPAGFRTLVDLKEDGTYSYSDSTGVVEGGISSITGFTKTGYTVDKITYGQGSYNGWDTFVVDHQSATEEEFWDAESGQGEKPNAEWYDFNGENVKLMFE